MKIEKRKYLILFIIIFTVISLTVGFSSYTDTLLFSNITAKFRLPDELRVTNFFVTSSSNDGESTYDEYNVNIISAGVTLPNQNSTVTYRVEVTNLSNAYAQIESITGLPSNITYELSDYTLGDDICDTNDRCRNGVVKDFLITFKYTTNGYNSNQTEYLINLTINFSMKYLVEYIGNIFYTTPKTENGVTIDYDPISSVMTINGTQNSDVGLMTLDNMSFIEGEQYRVELQYISGSYSSTGINFFSTYTRKSDNDLTSTPNWVDHIMPISGGDIKTIVINSSSETEASRLYSFLYVDSGASVTFNDYNIKVLIYKVETKKVSYGDNYVLPSTNPTRNNFAFNGWYAYEIGGNEITTNDILNEEDNKTFYAQWIDTDVMTEPIISWESNYVNNGLQILVDGRNNTGVGHDSATTTWGDLSGNNNNGSVNNGASWDNNSLSFDGSNDHVMFETSIYSEYMSLESSFSLDNIGSRRNIIGNPHDAGMQLWVSADGHITGEIYISSWIAIIDSNIITANTIYSASVTYDGTTLNLYVNGNLAATRAVSGTISSPQSGVHMMIGCHPSINNGCDNYYLSGKVYSARVYNRALTYAEVRNNYAVDSIYKGEYTNINPRVTISGGSSTIGIKNYRYIINDENNIGYYNPSNKPLVSDIGENIVYAKVVNYNNTEGPDSSETVNIDNVSPTGTLNVVIGDSINIEVNATDNLSGISKYGYALTLNSTCDSSVTDFVESNNNTYSLNPNTSVKYVCVKVVDHANNATYISQLLQTIFFSYTGNYQEFVAEETGYYYVETWGGKGGSSTASGGSGSYVSGYIHLTQGEKLYVYVGNEGGVAAANSTYISGGYNGGGTANYGAGAGGGATDIRCFINSNTNLCDTTTETSWNSSTGLNSRIMISGAGAGGGKFKNWLNGGSAGVYSGSRGGSYDSSSNGGGYGGSQTSGGSQGSTSHSNGSAGSYATGGTGGYESSSGSGGGGAGYYGGAGGAARDGGGGGGSSYLSGYIGFNSITSSRTHTNNTLHFSNKYFFNGSVTAATNSGKGKARIKYIGTSEPARKIPSMANVRYVRDCVNGNSANNGAHWVEIQVIKEGSNIAKGKTPTVDQGSLSNASYITDGLVNTSNYADGGDGNRCVTIDLENTYSVDEIGVWHYFSDGRTYYNNVTYVSSDGLLWNKVIESTSAETNLGKRVTAWSNKLEKDDSYLLYNGSYQTFTAPQSGYYEVETWGANGGKALCDGSACNTNAKGGYSSGYIYLNQNETIYVYIGGQGKNGAKNTNQTGGYNGGGNATYDNADDESAGSGGGSTDIRYFSSTPSSSDLAWNSTLGINSRIMVAAGAGGTSWNISKNPYGGGFFGGDGGATGASQTSGGAFGYGQNGSGTGDSNGVAGGGGGYYGGRTDTSTGSNASNSASGGSSFISGFAGVNAITSSSDRTHTNNTNHYSGKYFIKNSMQSNTNSGNGKARISYYGSSFLPRLNTNLNNTRYIKDCINGNTSNTGNHWGEIQAIKDGINLALNKTVTGTSPENNSTTHAYSYIVDGRIDNMTSSSGFGYTASTGLQCVTIDLENNYNLDEIAVWHYFNGGRRYYENVTYTSSDGIVWNAVIVNDNNETEYGKRVTVWEEPIIKYNLEYASNNSNCQLDSTTYASDLITYGIVVNTPNPTCTGYEFMGWDASGDINLSTAKYGTTNDPTTAWINRNKGTYFKNLTDVNQGTVLLTAVWTYDATPPTCSLNVSTSGISFGSKTDNVQVTAYDLTTSNTPTFNGNSSLNLANGNYYGHVKDQNDNTGMCSANVFSTSSYKDYYCPSGYSLHSQNPGWSTCPECQQRILLSADPTCSGGYQGGNYCIRCAGYKGYNWVYYCPSGTKLNNSYCYTTN